MKVLGMNGISVANYKNLYNYLCIYMFMWYHKTMEKKVKNLTRVQKAKKIFRANHGILRTSQALDLGIDRETLYGMRDSGELIREGRGIYRLAEFPSLTYPDLVKVSLRVSEAIICLISALHYHGLTTQIPHKVYIALPKNSWRPKIKSLALEVVMLSQAAYAAGIEEHELDGVDVKIYSVEKTIADSFKFRNKIGKRIAIEALKDYLRQPGVRLDILLSHARTNRVENIMRPYLEALL